MLFLLTAESLPVDQLLLGVPQQMEREGRELYRRGQATVTSTSPTGASISVDDKTGTPALVRISLSGNYLNLSCTCTRSFGWGQCKHKVAALLALRDYLTANPPRVWQAVLDRALQAQPRRSPTTGTGAIIFSLQQRGSAWLVIPYSLAGRFLPGGHSGDPELIASAIERGRLHSQLKMLRSQLSPESYATLPAEVIAAANVAIGSGSSYGYWHGGAKTLGIMLAMLPGCLVYLGDDVNPVGGGRISVNAEPASVEIDLARDSSGLNAHFRIIVEGRHVQVRPGHARILTREPLWMLVDDQVIRLADSTVSPDILATYPQLRIPADDEADFVERYLLPLTERLPVRGDAIAWEEANGQPQPRVYLSEHEGELTVELRFAYGDDEVPYEKSLPPSSVRRRSGSTSLVRIKRAPEAEQAAWQQLTGGFGLKRGPTPNSLLLRKSLAPVDFLLREVPRLANAGFTVFGEEALTVARINRNRPTISFNVSSGIDWFDVETVVQFGDQVLPLKDLRRALRRRERYVKLADGSLGAIPEDWIARYRHLFAFAEEHEQGMRLSSHHLALLDQALAEADGVATDAAFIERRDRLRAFEHIEHQPLPRGFVGELRDYQKAGYDWLHFLRQYGFGGCLADDMGLGKTIVALAFLQSIYEQEPRPAPTLVVMPRSLLFNWQREAERFAPGLRLYVHADQGRIKEAAAFDQYDVVLTTYGVMLRDIQLLRSANFHCVILDESQAIKNPFAETSRAARMLNPAHRFTLTGTPVENNALELWSQFAFLNPGLLGNLDYFREEFAGPIERKHDAETAQFLRKLVYPFILRRTKDQVATDLPPRTEELLIVEMEPAQRKLYARTRDYYRAMLLGMIDEQGIDDARMKILEGLLRLRQISNHPRLFDAKFRGSSAKFELLLETLETLRAEGHKALVFSQFVQMLSLIREALDARKIPYAYLDGSTRDREGPVQRFQSDPDLPFFLISLKAGGVGLNLTAADYVIHVDPWWNPAVEMQATDRTHRIGQTRPVFVYKLITQGTVEEKILGLQERKRALVEQLISTEGGVFKNLTRDDIEVLFT